ncbi:MAG: EAL domain-containing protein, partial [Lysobacteraceae bacterium]
YEMFLRLHGSDGGPVDASTYLPIAEEHGLLGEIDKWAIAKAIALIGERLRAGKRTSLLLSISQETAFDPAMPDLVGEQLVAAGVPGELLMLALPEAKVFTNLHDAQGFANGLGKYGAKLALEHFGAGLNSLQILQHFEPALLKIDPQFMDDLTKNADSQRKLKEIAQAASSRGIRTIAERVQDAASMTMLFSAGLDYVQGDFLAPPAPDMHYDFS